MAKRKLLIAAAILSVIVLSLALAACGPTPFDSMSSVQREYHEKYGESATALGPDGLVLYQDKVTELFGYLDATSGKVVIEAKYADAGKFAGGMAAVDAGNRNVPRRRSPTSSTWGLTTAAPSTSPSPRRCRRWPPLTPTTAPC